MHAAAGAPSPRGPGLSGEGRRSRHAADVGRICGRLRGPVDRLLGSFVVTRLSSLSKRCPEITGQTTALCDELLGGPSAASWCSRAVEGSSEGPLWPGTSPLVGGTRGPSGRVLSSVLNGAHWRESQKTTPTAAIYPETKRRRTDAPARANTAFQPCSLSAPLATTTNIVVTRMGLRLSRRLA
jgi:hypothetical protein